MLPPCMIHSFEVILMTSAFESASVCTRSVCDSVRNSRGGANCTGISRTDTKLSVKRGPLQHADGAFQQWRRCPLVLEAAMRMRMMMMMSDRPKC